jgi:hypothetical protein
MSFTENAPTAGDRPATIAVDLERARLQQRATRLAHVLTALRGRARAYEQASAVVPRPLSHSLTTFEQELDAVRRQLAGSSHRPAESPS